MTPPVCPELTVTNQEERHDSPSYATNNRFRSRGWMTTSMTMSLSKDRSDFFSISRTDSLQRRSISNCQRPFFVYRPQVGDHIVRKSKAEQVKCFDPSVGQCDERLQTRLNTTLTTEFEMTNMCMRRRCDQCTVNYSQVCFCARAICRTLQVVRDR